MKKVNCEMLIDYKDVLTLKDLIEILQISKTYAYKILQKGEIPSIKIGKNYRIFKVDLISYLTDKKI